PKPIAAPTASRPAEQFPQSIDRAAPPNERLLKDSVPPQPPRPLSHPRCDPPARPAPSPSSATPPKPRCPSRTAPAESRPPAPAEATTPTLRPPEAIAPTSQCAAAAPRRRR